MAVVTARRILDASQRLETPEDSDCFLPLAVTLSSLAGTSDGFGVAPVVSAIELHRQELARLLTERLTDLIAKNSECNSVMYWAIAGDISIMIARLASPPQLLADFIWRLIAQHDLTICHRGYYRWTPEGEVLYKICQSTFNR